MKLRIALIFLVFLSFAHADESVVLIHGFLRSKRSMKRVQRVLKAEGYRTLNYDYPSRNKTIKEHGADLAIALKEEAAKSPGDPIHFITHSMGGLVLRAALNDPCCPNEAKVGRAVLMSPPNQGSAFGRLLGQFRPVKKAIGFEAGKELTTRTDFNDIGEFPESIEVLVISGTGGWNPAIEGANDLVVGYDEGCLNTYHHHMAIPTTHSIMMFSESVIFNAVRFISASSQA